MASKTHESLDTNIILRVILKDVPKQCLRVQDLLMRMGIIYDVEDLAVTEAVYVLQGQGLSRAQIVDGLQKLFKLPSLNINLNLFNLALPMYLENPRLSFNDCCLATHAMLNEAEPLWTFDKALAKVSSTAQLA